jgi:GxxExxY protein
MTARVGKVQTPYDDLTYKINGLAMAIHNELGPGFSEEIYRRAMMVGLTSDGIPFATEHRIEVSFRGQTIGALELDFVIDSVISVLSLGIRSIRSIR